MRRLPARRRGRDGLSHAAQCSNALRNCGSGNWFVLMLKLNAVPLLVELVRKLQWRKSLELEITTMACAVNPLTVTFSAPPVTV